MTQSASVNVGIIGGGLMGREVASALQRWPALQDHPVLPRLTAVCDIDPNALAWFDQIDSVRLRCTNYRDLLDDETVDVVYVAVRHDLHAEIYGDVIRSGKSLLAEKPFGIDGAAAGQILAAMADHPESFVRCSSEMPFFPGAQLALRYVQSGVLGQIIEARSAFLHAGDLDVDKPINWKRQAAYCGEAGVLNDLGMHVWHVPLRLGWIPKNVYAVLQNLVQTRKDGAGQLVPCDTWDNATLISWVAAAGQEFPLTTVTKRIDPGQKNTWEFEAIGMSGGVRFSTKRPKSLEVFAIRDIAGVGSEQVWQCVDVGSQSTWPTVTGANFETGFSDAILQMWASYLAERAGMLGDRFGTARPKEAALTHAVFDAALRSHQSGRVESV